MSKWAVDLESYKTAVEAHLANNVALDYARFFKGFFQEDAISGYEWPDIQRIGEHLHCFQSMALSRKRALGNPNHPIEHYRESFRYLAHGDDEVVVRIDRFSKDDRYSLLGFGPSAISEICAYLFAVRIFMHNSRDKWAAERYGLTPTYPKGSTFGQKLMAFGEAMRPLVADYEKIVGRQTDLPLNLEVDQFFSYMYEKEAVPESEPKKPAAKNVWVIGCGSNGEKWEEFRDGKVVAVGFPGMGDLREYKGRDVIAEQLRKIDGTGGSKTNDTLAAWQFTYDMKPGDTVIAKQGRRKIFGIGMVTSDYRFDKSRSSYQNVRDVEWKSLGDWTLPEDRQITTKTLTRATDWGPWLDMVFKMTGVSEDEVEPQNDYKISDALEGLFMSGAFFREMLAQLRLKQNIVLQGPPGVGKTYVAKRLAYALMGEKDPTRVDMVQFHQSYSYEDFVQGLRPDNEGKFHLQDGVFYRFCKKAAEDDRPYVFIIDEVNRGNLSRILGELMMLIEADKRGPAWAVNLTYGGDGESFHVPENVYIIGTMNTADRSLAMVDYALRRRFSFLTLDPAYSTEGFREHLEGLGVPDTLIAKINGRIERLNERIAKDTKGLGPGFRIGHSYFCPREGDEPTEDWYRRVVKYEIVPLLEEYWFDDDGKVSQARDELLAQ